MPHLFYVIHPPWTPYNTRVISCTIYVTLIGGCYSILAFYACPHVPLVPPLHGHSFLIPSSMGDPLLFQISSLGRLKSLFVCLYVCKYENGVMNYWKELFKEQGSKHIKHSFKFNSEQHMQCLRFLILIKKLVLQSDIYITTQTQKIGPSY